MNMYDLVIRVHIIISVLFFLVAFLVIFLSAKGWAKGSAVTRLFHLSGKAYITILYLQLCLGVILYFFLKPDMTAGEISQELAAQHYSLRFWAIEHVSLMLFALIFAQTGFLMIRRMTIDRKIYRSATFYYGTAFLVVLFSVALAIIKNLL